MSKESKIHRIQHPSIVKVHTNTKDIKKREFENFNIILIFSENFITSVLGSTFSIS